MATQQGYETDELTYAQRNPQTIMLSDGVRARKTNAGFVVEVLDNDNTTWTELGSGGGAATVVASGTAVLGTTAIGSGALATAVSVSATGVLTTDTIIFTPNADISAVTGYSPATTGGLIIYPYPTADHVNFKVGNPTASSVTPGAVTLNWVVIR